MKLTYSQKQLIAQVLSWDRHQETRPEEVLDYRVKLDMIYFKLSGGGVAPIHKATFNQIKQRILSQKVLANQTQN